MAIDTNLFHQNNHNRLREKALGNPEYEGQVFVHPEDDELIKNVTEKLSENEISAIFVPYLTGTTLAFIARHISLITVGRHRATYYSPDPSFLEAYNSLYSFSSYALISEQFPIRTCGSQKAKGWLARTPSQILDAAESDFIIVDSRNLNSVGSVQNFLEMTLTINAKILFLFREHNPKLEEFLQEEDCVFDDDHPLGIDVSIPDGLLGNHYNRLNNYSKTVEMESIIVKSSGKHPLENLQAAFNKCIKENRDYGIGFYSMSLRYLKIINQYYQNFICPSSYVSEAKDELGTTWWEGHLLSIRNEGQTSDFEDYGKALLEFCDAVEKAREHIKENHLPKTQWLMENLNSTKDKCSLYCQSEEEYVAVYNWMRSSGHNYNSEVQPVDRKYLLQKSCEQILISPGPHIVKNHWIAPSGAAALLKVLIYPWQKSEWNVLRRKVEGTMKKVSGFLKPKGIEYEVDEEEEDKLELPPQTDMELVFKDYSDHVQTDTIQVEFGTEEYGVQRCALNSLIPTLSEDKFVDRLASQLRVGDVIWIRTDGMLIDARQHVDQMAKVDPHLKEAAEKANAWRTLFIGTVAKHYKKDNPNYTIRDLYDELYPDEAVSIVAFIDWLLEPTRIAPTHSNLQELMVRLGYSEELADKLYKDVRYYYNLRKRIYSYMGRRIRKHLSQAYGGTLDLEAEDNYEIGLTFEAIDNMIKFAKVTSAPAIVEE